MQDAAALLALSGQGPGLGDSAQPVRSGSWVAACRPTLYCNLTVLGVVGLSIWRRPTPAEHAVHPHAVMSEACTQYLRIYVGST